MKRILVIATRQIGDVLLTTPLVRAARRRWPEARIEMLGFQGTLGMLAGNPDIDACIETPARLGWGGFWRLARQLWRRYDLALVTQPGDRAHALGWLAARTRSGLLPEAGGSNWWKRALLDHAVTIAGDRGAVHVTVEKLALLDPWLAGPPRVPQVVPPAAAPLPAELAARLRPGYVALHAPSMWEYKQWPLAHYAEVVRALLARDIQVVLTGSAGQRDQACIEPLRALAEPPALVDASGWLDFRQLRTLLEGAAVYVGPDTSVSHLAAATGTPTVALFGPTNPLRWAPWPAKAAARELFERSARRQVAGNVALLQGPQDCVPCGRAGCEDHRDSRSDCLQSIPPALVVETVLAQIVRPVADPKQP
ncbi:glycosyltransferase family 9 protein [Ramlibacter sp. MAHUQ-53]|uniref:glycosyltransferase family 9 protein n=1 Tax=unclassified Ramlibacter TaxID=2617605 RepID=UPI00363BE775